MLTLVWCFDCFLAPAQHWDQGARLACNGLRTERFIISQLRGRRRRRRRTRRRRRMKGKGKFCAFCPIFGQWIFFCLDFTKRTLTSNQCNIKSAQICFTHLGWRHKRFQTGQLLRKSSFHWSYLAGNSRQGGQSASRGLLFRAGFDNAPNKGRLYILPQIRGVYFDNTPYQWCLFWRHHQWPNYILTILWPTMAIFWQHHSCKRRKN